MIETALKWIVEAAGTEPSPDYYCPTRDIADGRLPKLVTVAAATGFSEERAPLIAALSGELTANCFDHNRRGLKFIVAALEREFRGSMFRLYSGTARFDSTFPIGSRDLIQLVTSGQPALKGTVASLEIKSNVK